MAKACYECSRKIGPKPLCFDCLGLAGNSDQLTARRYELRKALTKNSLERVLLRLSLLFHCCFKWLTNYPTCCFLLFLSVCFYSVGVCWLVIVVVAGRLTNTSVCLLVCMLLTLLLSALLVVVIYTESDLKVTVDQSRLDRCVPQLFLFVSGPP